MTNKANARTLRPPSQGANTLHTGPIAQAIVAKAEDNRGDDPTQMYPKFDDLAGFIEL